MSKKARQMIAMSHVVKGNDKILKTVCKEKSHEESKRVALKLVKIAGSFEYCIGLSAPQIGIDARVFITRVDGNTNVFINPVVETFGEETCEKEGCMSYPGVFVDIARPDGVGVEYTDINGNLQRSVFYGLESRVIQHENDHLNGVTIFKR